MSRLPPDDPRAAFMAARRRWRADEASAMGHALKGVETTVSMVGDMLTCLVTAMPVDRFNRFHVLDGPGHLCPVLTMEGETTWNALTTLGLSVVAPGALFALILHPDALDSARATLAARKAA